MNPETRKKIELLHQVGSWLNAHDEEWQRIKFKAIGKNAWFTEEHIDYAVKSICNEFLEKEKLTNWVKNYSTTTSPKTIGIVMAGNIPLVGFHDFLCLFLSGHKARIKLSSKDEELMKGIFNYMCDLYPAAKDQVVFDERIAGCDAYIATGSNNTSRYFEQYFGNVPNIIRKNRTSVALLTGNESENDLEALADDIYMFYGLGCRNVTQVLVPKKYNFEPLVNACKRHNHYADLNKYKNNYDYHLALYLLNRVPYMSNDSLLLVENDMPFSAVSVLHYKYYENLEKEIERLKTDENIQAIVGSDFIPFGKSQSPQLNSYADGVDTMAFLSSLG